MPRRIPWIALFACLLGLLPLRARAHDMTITQVVVAFDRPGTIAVKIDLDLTALLGSPEDYFALSAAPPEAQRKTIEQLLPTIAAGLQLHIGEPQLPLVFQSFTVPRLSAADFDDPGIDKFTTLNFIAVLPARRDPLTLIVPNTAQVAYPVAFTVQIPTAKISETTFMEEGTNESDPFDWAEAAPQADATAVAGAPTSSPTAAPPTPANPAALDVETMPWTRQLPMYLRLGFHHIVPEGTDHILFVLGLFFLGITWRKLLFQTSVFTVAHATTLFLSTYGIFSLPSKYVEPAIALSIAFIALENVFNPRLGPGRLAVVFCFGLIHGLGFASSLSEVPFPKHQFIVALLGFNFGVDFGQLFIIALAFLAVGWWRNRPWFRARIAIPCSVTIAAIGIFWAIQRLFFYYGRH
jgi:HupE/UreJ protein